MILSYDEVPGDHNNGHAMDALSWDLTEISS